MSSQVKTLYRRTKGETHSNKREKMLLPRERKLYYGNNIYILKVKESVRAIFCCFLSKFLGLKGLLVICIRIAQGIIIVTYIKKKKFKKKRKKNGLCLFIFIVVGPVEYYKYKLGFSLIASAFRNPATRRSLLPFFAYTGNHA